jgi:hypothetical protein
MASPSSLALQAWFAALAGPANLNLVGNRRHLECGFLSSSGRRLQMRAVVY